MYRYRKDGSFISLTLCNSFWWLNQFCRLCNYLNRKPTDSADLPADTAGELLCSRRSLSSCHPQPKAAAVRRRVRHCRAPRTCCLPGCRLTGSSTAMEPLGKPSRCLRPLPSCLSASWEKL